MADHERRNPACAFALALMMLASCRETGGEGALFEVSGKMFVFNYRVATATYLVTLNPLRPMGEGQVAVATFEDPAGGEPIVVEQKVWPKLGKVVLESPPLSCVVKDRPYSVSVSIEDAGGGLLQKLETTIVSSLDQTILPDAPLVVGPVYTPNPVLAGRPDGKLDRGPDSDCPVAG